MEKQRPIRLADPVAAAKTLAGHLERFAWFLRSLDICQQCCQLEPITHRVTSDMIDLHVCEECAKKAPTGKGPGALTVERIQTVAIAAPRDGNVTIIPLGKTANLAKGKEVDVLLYALENAEPAGSC